MAHLCELLIGTGMRKGEALGLHWSDVHLTEQVLCVRYTLSAVDNNCLVLIAPKTRSSKAWVAISPRVAAARVRQRELRACPRRPSIPGLRSPPGTQASDSRVMNDRHTLIQLTDTHIVAEGLLHGRVDSPAALRSALAAVVASGVRVDALVLSGDLTDQGDEASYRLLAAELAPVVERLGCAPVVAAGNHDDRSALWTGLLGQEPSGEPVLDVTEVRGLRIVTLDSSVPGRAHGELDRGQLDWLAGVLAEPAPAGTVLVLHHPPVRSAVPGMDEIGLREPHRLTEILSGSDVRLVLHGHTHCAAAGVFVGIPVWSGPATAYTLDALPPAGTTQGMPGAAFTRIDLCPDEVLTSVVTVPAAGTEPLYQFRTEDLGMLIAAHEAEHREGVTRNG